jgi:glycosyltransferase involved in cell wall biosynthesis
MMASSRQHPLTSRAPATLERTPTAGDARRLVFISWAPNCSRSDNIARELGGVSYMVYFPVFGSTYWTILFKYFCQAVETLFLLFRDRPRSVICMNPPVVALLPVWLYCALMPRRGYVIDHHTAAFVLRIYQRLYFMQRFFAKRAIVNLLTNSHLASIVSGWGGRVQLVGDVRVRFAKIQAFEGLRAGFNVTFVSRYSNTEPLDVVYEAARRLHSDGIHIFVTGDLKDAPQQAIDECPENVTLTNFLSEEAYAGLLRDSDAVMCLCTNDNTMQRGAYEAMAVETPLVLSDWQLLRDTFSSGAVYVDNSVEGICAGIRTLRSDVERYQRGIRELRTRRATAWERTLAELNQHIDRFTAERAG